MTKADPRTHIPSKGPQPVLTMIVPGRRAYGEDWRKVTIGHDRGNNYTLENEPHEKPADGHAVIVAGEVERVVAEHILTAQMEKAELRVKNPQDMSIEERTELINAAWLDFIEQKLKHFKGQSQFGPSGFKQREKVHHSGK